MDPTSEEMTSSFHAGVVTKLIALFEVHSDLKSKFENGFGAQPESSYWHSKSIESLYPFFQEWLIFDPLLNTAKTYIDRFRDFYSLPGHRGQIKEAREAIRDPRFVDWLKKFVEARGAYLNSPLSKPLVDKWIEKKKINIAHYQLPKNGFSSFSEFFTRKIKPGLRPVSGSSDCSIIVSPSDGLVWEDSKWLADKGEKLAVKGDEYNLEELVADKNLANKYRNGKGVVNFLSTHNYHRFHSPADGEVTYRKDLDGLYFGTKGFVSYFHERRRSVCEIQTESGGSLCLVAIGIATISSVVLNPSKGVHLSKGDEIGHFTYGGSAIVLIFSPGTLSHTLLDEESGPYRVETANMRVGQRLGNLNKKKL